MERELGIEGAQDVMVYAHSSGPGIFLPELSTISLGEKCRQS